jgi:paraquat-inducible protein B
MLAAGTMFYRNWSKEGPTIYVQFASAPGIKPQKTQLYYRGVEAGTVTGIQLGRNLDNVLVKVRLLKHAEELARQGTLFWIDQPVFNLAKPSGIESLIEGNSLQARKGSGPQAYFFIGSDEVPVAPLEGEPLFVRLFSESIPFVEPGAEVTYRGLPIGLVRSKGLDESGNPYVELGFAKRYADLVRSNARFWSQPPWSFRVGAGIFRLDVPSLKNLFLGGIAMDYFGSERGEPVRSSDTFRLHPGEQSAMAVSEPITLEFKNGQGLTEGMTQLRYLGLPVGIVEKASPQGGRVMVSVRFREGYDFLRRKGAMFTIVRPQVEIPKISGLETLVSGVYIECLPGTGAESSRFSGTSQEEAELIDYEQGGFEVRLTSSSTKISAGTPVLCRGVRVGKITRKQLDPSGTGVVLTASILPKYAGFLRSNSHFWNISGVKISGGLINLNVQSSTLEGKGLGGVEFSTPSGQQAGDPVKENHTFQLFDSPRREWLLWAP